MTETANSASAQWYRKGLCGYDMRAMKASGRVFDLIEFERSAGAMSRTGLPDFVLGQDMLGGSRLVGDFGGGHFDVASEKGDLYLSAPNFSLSCTVDARHKVRAVAFPLAQWQVMLEDVTEGRSSFDFARLHCGKFKSPTIERALRRLWALCDDEGTPSLLLARAAGFEILAELCRLSGEPVAVAKGGLAPWAERRCLELMHARIAEDISLDELAAEAKLSPFHFARMFKQSTGVPPRVYLTRLRIEKACELLELTDIPITEIAMDVGYSSNQVLARVFTKHMRMAPSEYRRTVREPVRSMAVQ